MTTFPLSSSQSSRSRHSNEWWKKNDSTCKHKKCKMSSLLVLQLLMRVFPVVNVRLNGTLVYEAFLDGGSGVNVLSTSLCAELGISNFESTPFFVKMADQHRVQPLGLVKGLDLDIVGIRYKIAAVMLKMEDISGAYPLLLGRPWLHNNKHRTGNIIWFPCKGARRRSTCPCMPPQWLSPPLRPKYAEGINMADGVNDSKEEQYLSKNESLVGLFEIDVASLLANHKSLSTRLWLCFRLSILVIQRKSSQKSPTKR